MSIGNNRGRRKAFFAWTSSGSIVSASIIIAFTLLLAGSGFVLINHTLMIATTAFAQEENNTTAGTITTSYTTATTTSSGIELSPQPIWQERVATTGVTPINETHSIVDFDGSGTMTVPDTGETLNMTNNGTAIISPVTGAADTVSAYGKENVFSEDGDTTAITFFEIVQYQPEPFQGRGLVMAVFDRNATGNLAPFNGMMVVGTHEEQPNAEGTTITLWEWQSGITLPLPPTTMEESPPSPMNTTTMTNATADTNPTASDEEGEEEQQQQTTTIPAPLLE
jgi:hypothetical protein